MRLQFDFTFDGRFIRNHWYTWLMLDRSELTTSSKGEALKDELELKSGISWELIGDFGKMTVLKCTTDDFNSIEGSVIDL